MSADNPNWTTDPELTALRYQVFKNVGKSIYLYQEVEKRIKFLSVALSMEMTGPQDSWPDQLAKMQNRINKDTMGILMRDVMEKLYFSAEAEKPSKASEPSDAIKMRWRFSLQTTAEYLHERRDIIDAFVEERNQLVHHYFEQVNFASVDMLTKMSNDLEAQLQRIDDEIKHLNQIIQLLQESSKAESNWWYSEEGTRQLEVMRLQNSIPIHFLEWYPATKANADGWSIFQAACSELKKQQPEEIESFFKTFPYKSLQAAATASGLFEFMDEVTAKGQRVLYRLKAADYEYTTTFHSPV